MTDGVIHVEVEAVFPSLLKPVIVHSWQHAVAALTAARSLGCVLTLVSGPGAAAYAGAAFFKALADQAAARFPDVAVQAVLDCAESPGLVLGAVRTEVGIILFTGSDGLAARLQEIAVAHNCRLIRTLDPALDLLRVSDPSGACLAWLEEVPGSSPPATSLDSYEDLR